MFIDCGWKEGYNGKERRVGMERAETITREVALVKSCCTDIEDYLLIGDWIGVMACSEMILIMGSRMAKEATEAVYEEGR